MQYSEKSCNGLLLKFSMKPVEQLTVTPCYCLEVHFFGSSNYNWLGCMQNITQGYSTQRKDQTPQMRIVFFPHYFIYVIK